MNILIRVSIIQERLAIPFLIMSLLAYVISWFWEPYAYGYSVLILAPIQLVWGIIGLVFTAVGLSNRPKLLSLLVSVVLVGSALGAFWGLKSINWA